MNKILEIKNLSIDYTNNHSSKKILDDINIDLYKGETLGIVGESGSGKTITGLAIAGLLDKKVFSEFLKTNIKSDIVRSKINTKELAYLIMEFLTAKGLDHDPENDVVYLEYLLAKNIKINKGR